MERRAFVKYGAGVLLFPAYSLAKDADFSNDALLRTNLAVLPVEREEKRIFDNSNPEKVKWDTTVCKDKLQLEPVETYTIDMAYIESMATDAEVPYVTFSAKQDAQSTDKKGFYLSFSVGVSLLASPRQKPDELVSTTSNYFNCLNDLRQQHVKCNKCASIDCRKVKIISDNKTYSPTRFVHKPSKAGVLLETPAVLKELATVYEFSREIWITLFFEINPRPIRFKLVPPPLYFHGVKVPLPICFFEPYDLLTGEWA